MNGRPKDNFIPVIFLLPEEKYYANQVQLLTMANRCMHQVFKMYFRLYILHVYMILPLNNTQLQIYSYEPYKSATNCGDLSPILLRTITMPLGKVLQHIFTARKNNNFNGCTVVVVTEDMPPYITLAVDEPYVRGVDGEILQLLAQKINFTIQIQLAKITSAHVYPNKTATGVFKWIMEKRANMSIGDLSCTPQRLQHLSFTRPYYQTEMFCLLAARKYTSLEVLFLPLNKPVLIFGIILLVTHIALKKILLRIWKNNPFMQHMLQQKLLLIFIYICIFYRLLYESTYFSYVQTPPLKSLPSNTHQLHEEGYTIVSDYMSRNYIERMKGDELSSIVLSTTWSRNESIDFLKENRHTDVCLITKLPYLTYYMNNVVSLQLSKKYVLYVDQNCYFFPKYSFLAEPIDNTLLRLNSFGIIKYIFKRQNFTIAETGKRLLHSVTNPQPINFTNIAGPLKLYFIVLCCFTVVFLLEIYFHRYTTSY